MLLCLIVLTFPVNYELFAGLRVVDILIVCLIVVALPAMRVRLSLSFYLALLFLGLYTVSILWSLFAYDIVTPTNLLFIFKYLAVFLFIWVLVSVPISPAGVRLISRLLFLVFALLVLYTFYFVLRWARGSMKGNVRVSFPFSNAENPGSGDPHLYAVVLSTCLIGYLFYPRRRTVWTMLVAAAVAGVTVAAIVLSGSRMGLVSIPVTLLVYVIRRGWSALLRLRFRVRWSSLVLAALAACLLAVLVSRLLSVDNALFTRLTTRAFNFDPSQDGSLANRITKTRFALERIFNGPLLLGIGLQSTMYTWFDVGYASVLYTTGLLGLTTVLGCIAAFLRERRAEAVRFLSLPAYQALEYGFINLLTCAIGSEFYLVTRGMVPFAVLVGLFVQMIRHGDGGDREGGHSLRPAFSAGPPHEAPT